MPVCRVCGEKRANAARPYWCKSCVRKEAAWRYEHDTRYRASVMLGAAKKRAEKGGVPFDLDIDWLSEKLDLGVCEASGIRLSFRRPRGVKHGAMALSPSLDRIDSFKGYTRENSRVICHFLNCAFGSWGEADTIPLLIRYLRHSTSRFPGLKQLLVRGLLNE